MKKALEEQRQKILTMKENSDSAMTLKRDLEAAKNQFELVSTRTSRVLSSTLPNFATCGLIMEPIPSPIWASCWRLIWLTAWRAVT